MFEGLDAPDLAHALKKSTRVFFSRPLTQVLVGGGGGEPMFWQMKIKEAA